MKKLIYIICFFTSFVNAQKIHYNLRMSKPQNHYFEVEMQVLDYKGEEFEVKMPVWAPGSYLVREFSKNVNQVIAKDEKGTELQVTKTAKNTWKIKKGKAKIVSVIYEVYAFELSVRTSFLDLTHGFVSGSGIFMYVEKLKNNKGTLTVFPYKDFKKVTTALVTSNEQIQKDGSFTFQYDNYDQLVDCPIEIGNHEVFDFTSEGVKHTVAIYGPGNFDVELLKKDMAKITSTATQVFGVNPNKNYTFIIHNVLDGQGGLEHTNSTTLSVNRWTYQGSEYIGFLSLVAHEYFHLWNVKRIRPIELGPFNYDAENYTSLLWVMEGFTSYYDELLLRRAGYYSTEQMLQKINSSINYVEGTEGSRVQSVAHSSFDAWIKAYRPNENSSNTTMTYYTRGAMIAALLDAKICTKFSGKKSLDDFLRYLYQEFYVKKNRGFSEYEFEQALTTFMEEDMRSFLTDYVYGTKTPDFNQFFNPLGVKVEYTGMKKSNLGAAFNVKDGKSYIKTIRTNSAAELAGLSVNDEIIGIDGFRLDASEVESVLNAYMEGDKFTLLIAREDRLMEIEVVMGSYEKPSYRLSIQDSKNTLLNFWMR